MAGEPHARALTRWAEAVGVARRGEARPDGRCVCVAWRGAAGRDVQVRCDVSFAVESIKTETHYDVQVR